MRPAARDLAIVLVASWLARAAFVAVVGDAHSVDVDYWRGALDAIDEGRNPYETGVLNWPPLWLTVIVGVDAVADAVGVSFLSGLRVLLVLVESALVVTLYLTLVSLGASRSLVRRALLVGVALNPVAILLVCQHGNSDVVVGLLVTLAIAALIAYERSRDAVVWLGACLLLGLGVLAKTVPLVLAPLLAPGARQGSWTTRGLALALFLGPAALGVVVILALAPEAVTEHVLRYRSTRGFFGSSGLLYLMSEESKRYVEWLFAVGLTALLAWIGWRLWRQKAPTSAERLFLLTAVILIVVVALGPGYGPQYAYWVLPPLVATYVLLDDGWRQVLRVAYVVAAATYVVEYAFVPWLGAYAAAVFPGSEWVDDLSRSLNVPHRLVLFTLPLFVVYLVLAAEGIARLGELSTARRRPGHLPSPQQP
jgi:hypothetical protein